MCSNQLSYVAFPSSTGADYAYLNDERQAGFRLATITEIRLLNSSTYSLYAWLAVTCCNTL